VTRSKGQKLLTRTARIGRIHEYFWLFCIICRTPHLRSAHWRIYQFSDCSKAEKKEVMTEERLFLQPGDRVRIKHDEVDLHCDFPGTYIIATEGSIGVVVSYDEYRVYYEQILGQHHINKDYLSGIKEAMGDWCRYPIKFEKVAPAADMDAVVCCKEGQIELISVDILEKIVYFDSRTLLVIDQVSIIVMPDGSEPQAEDGRKLLAIRFSVEHQGAIAVRLSSSRVWLACSDLDHSHSETGMIEPSQLELPKGELLNGIRSYGWAVFPVPEDSHTYTFGFEISQVGRIKTILRPVVPKLLLFLPFVGS
jgi:hypothetical protein